MAQGQDGYMSDDCAIYRPREIGSSKNLSAAIIFICIRGFLSRFIMRRDATDSRLNLQEFRFMEGACRIPCFSVKLRCYYLPTPKLASLERSTSSRYMDRRAFSNAPAWKTHQGRVIRGQRSTKQQSKFKFSQSPNLSSRMSLHLAFCPIQNTIISPNMQMIPDQNLGLYIVPVALQEVENHDFHVKYGHWS